MPGGCFCLTIRWFVVGSKLPRGRFAKNFDGSISFGTAKALLTVVAYQTGHFILRHIGNICLPCLQNSTPYPSVILSSNKSHSFFSILPSLSCSASAMTPTCPTPIRSLLVCFPSDTPDYKPLPDLNIRPTVHDSTCTSEKSYMWCRYE